VTKNGIPVTRDSSRKSESEIANRTSTPTILRGSQSLGITDITSATNNLLSFCTVYFVGHELWYLASAARSGEWLWWVQGLDISRRRR
jgi:hypothetical protein